ncbi:MAG TPA: Ig-like domain-containing protein [Candidatus Limnocylindrales bacterium]|jgi:hypothetical protein|nr:Ig-like domain-containing protein [Candidatus Limnocylindrales bacterium]
MRALRSAAIGAAVALVGLVGTQPAAAGLLPIAVADSYNVAHDQTRTVTAPGVLANDLQLGGGFTAQLVNNVAHGSLDLDPDGGFRYDPDSGYAGTDTFRYRVDGGLLGLSNTATVTLTVATAPPTPTPSPTPEPTPAPTAAPTPQPTPRPTSRPTATPQPTVAPLPSLPVPTIVTLPTLVPKPSSTPTTAARPTPTPTPRGSTNASPEPSLAAPGGPVSPSGGGPGSVPGQGQHPPTGRDAPPFLVSAGAEELDLDLVSISFTGFEWAVPALVLTVPGLLIVIAVLVQSLIGLAWLPVARRWLGNDRRRRPAVSGAGGR